MQEGMYFTVNHRFDCSVAMSRRFSQIFEEAKLQRCSTIHFKSAIYKFGKMLPNICFSIALQYMLFGLKKLCNFYLPPLILKTFSTKHTFYKGRTFQRSLLRLCTHLTKFYYYLWKTFCSLQEHKIPIWLH